MKGCNNVSLQTSLLLSDPLFLSSSKPFNFHPPPCFLKISIWKNQVKCLNSTSDTWVWLSNALLITRSLQGHLRAQPSVGKDQENLYVVSWWSDDPPNTNTTALCFVLAKLFPMSRNAYKHTSPTHRCQQNHQNLLCPFVWREYIPGEHSVTHRDWERKRETETTASGGKLGFMCRVPGLQSCAH